MRATVANDAAIGDPSFPRPQTAICFIKARAFHLRVNMNSCGSRIPLGSKRMGISRTKKSSESLIFRRRLQRARPTRSCCGQEDCSSSALISSYGHPSMSESVTGAAFSISTPTMTTLVAIAHPPGNSNRCTATVWTKNASLSNGKVIRVVRVNRVRPGDLRPWRWHVVFIAAPIVVVHHFVNKVFRLDDP